MEKVIIKFKGIEYDVIEYLKENRESSLFAFFYRRCDCSGERIGMSSSGSCNLLTSVSFTAAYKEKNAKRSKNHIEYYGKLYVFLKCIIALEKSGLNLSVLYEDGDSCMGIYKRDLPDKAELLQKLYRLATAKPIEIHDWW